MMTDEQQAALDAATEAHRAYLMTLIPEADPEPVSGDEALLKPHEVAEMLGVAVKTLAQWRVKGCGPPFRKLGSLVRYDRREEDEWHSAQQSTTGN